MSDPRRPDPLRALDDVEAPDQWDDVVARSARGDHLVEPAAAGRGRAARVLVAAVLVVVVGAVVAVVASGGGDDGEEVATDEAPTADTAPDGIGEEEPVGFWGRTWRVEAIVETPEGSLDPRVIAPPADGSPLRLDATVEGRVAFNGCNGAGGAAEVRHDPMVDLDVLVVEELGPTTDMGCHEALMAQEEWLGGFLLDRPLMEPDGPRLRLRTEAATIDLVAEDALDDLPAPDGDEPGAVIDDPEPWTPPERPFDDPARLGAGTWEVVRVTEGDETTSWEVPVDVFPPAVALVGHEPNLGYSCASSLRRTYALDGPRLVSTEVPDVPGDRTDCSGDTERQGWLMDFLDTGPEVRISDDRMSLVSGTTQVDLVLAVEGRLWLSSLRLVEVVEDGGPPGAVPSEEGAPPALHLGPYGWIRLTTCAERSTGGLVHDGVLEVAGRWATNIDTCAGASAAGRDRDAWLVALLEASPTVTVDGERVTLAAGDDRATFEVDA